MSAKEAWTFGGVPGTFEGAVVAMTFFGEPQHDQAVQQHRHRRGSLDGAARPALRFFKAQRLLAVVEGDFQAPTHRVPGQHLLGIGLRARRVERLARSSAQQGLDRHHAQGSRGGRVNAGLAVAQAHLVVAAIDVERDAPRCALEASPRAWATTRRACVGGRWFPAFARAERHTAARSGASGWSDRSSSAVHSARFARRRHYRPARENAGFHGARTPSAASPRPTRDACDTCGDLAGPTSCSSTSETRSAGRTPARASA